jgi:hypothetical protein
VHEVDFPAVTFCNPRGHDTGEYVRSIFDNFDFLNTTEFQTDSDRLKELFAPFLTAVAKESFGTNLIEWSR